ncbi:MAG: zinc-binding dehydrogenase [Pseudomonadota bacterium]
MGGSGTQRGGGCAGGLQRDGCCGSSGSVRRRVRYGGGDFAARGAAVACGGRAVSAAEFRAGRDGAALLNVFRRRKTRLGVNADRREDLERLSEMVARGALRPVIDTSYPLEEAALAHAHVETRHRKGAIVLRIGAPVEGP